MGESNQNDKQAPCLACEGHHPKGQCPLKLAGVEHCGLCGLAHFGHKRTCPHLNSELQVRTMLAELKNSTEQTEDVKRAVDYLRGVLGGIVRKKKEMESRKKEMELRKKNEAIGAQAVQRVPNVHAVNGHTSMQHAPHMIGAKDPSVHASSASISSTGQRRGKENQQSGFIFPTQAPGEVWEV